MTCFREFSSREPEQRHGVVAGWSVPSLAHAVATAQSHRRTCLGRCAPWHRHTHDQATPLQVCRGTHMRPAVYAGMWIRATPSRPSPTSHQPSVTSSYFPCAYAVACTGSTSCRYLLHECVAHAGEAGAAAAIIEHPVSPAPPQLLKLVEPGTPRGAGSPPCITAPCHWCASAVLRGNVRSQEGGRQAAVAPCFR